MAQQLKKNNGQVLEQVSLGSLDKSSFVQDYNVRGTGNLGKLIPIRAYSTLPGDRVKSNTGLSVNFQPVANPMLDNLYMKFENFKVPYRILWDKWEEFWTKGEDLKSVLKPPTISFADFQYLFRELGFPIFSTIADKLLHEVPLFDPSKQSYDYLDVYAYDYISDSYVQTIDAPANALQPIFPYLTLQYETSFNTFRNNLTDLATTLGITDLLDDVYQAIDAMEEFLSNNKIKVSGEQRTIIPIFDYEYDGDNSRYILRNPIVPQNVFSTSQDIINAPISYANQGNKYIDELQHSILKTIQTLFSNSFPITNEGHEAKAYTILTTYAHLFHPDFLYLVQCLYDIIKPFVGVGSNWDMLGYGAVKYVDLLFPCIINVFNGDDISLTDEFRFFERGNMPYNFNALDLRALYCTWYWFYRDVLLEKDAPEPRKTDTILYDEVLTLLVMRHRCWEKDTFTTSLADTGNGSVVVPLQDGVVDGAATEYVSNVQLKDEQSVQLQGMDAVTYTLTDGTKLQFPSRFLLGKHDVGVKTENDVRDTAFSLDTLDRARTAQKWLSKALVYGNRPEDALYTRWRVKYADSRLQLPEFISKHSTLARQDVLVNNTTNEISNAGDKAANMFVNTQGAGFNEFFYEHGLLLTLLTVMPENDYGFGRRRDVSRLDAFDYPDPDFARLGYDAVYTDELVIGAVGPEFAIDEELSMPLGVFGYQRRYYDYVTKHSEIHGELLDTMDHYTFARKFSVYDPKKFPLLNYRFVHCHPRTDMFVMDDPRVSLLWFDVHHSQVVTRALPVVSQVF